jgi:hypothetical protein
MYKSILATALVLAIAGISGNAYAQCTEMAQPSAAPALGQGARVSINRGRAETSTVAILVEIQNQLRADGAYSPEGPNGNYYSYPINNPSYFAPKAGERKNFSASMAWSNGDGTGNTHPPVRTTLCLVINGATINFYTGQNDPYPDTIVRFDFYPAM